MGGFVGITTADDFAVPAVEIHAVGIGTGVLVEIHSADTAHAIDREGVSGCLIGHTPRAAVPDVAIAVPVVGRTSLEFLRPRAFENLRDVEIGAAERECAGHRKEKEETHDGLIKWGWVAGR